MLNRAGLGTLSEKYAVPVQTRRSDCKWRRNRMKSGCCGSALIVVVADRYWLFVVRPCVVWLSGMRPRLQLQQISGEEIQRRFVPKPLRLLSKFAPDNNRPKSIMTAAKSDPEPRSTNTTSQE